MRERAAVAVMLLAATPLGCRARPVPRLSFGYPGRSLALRAAVQSLFRSRGVESPGVVASSADGICSEHDLDRRLRCHMDRPTVQVHGERSGAGWLFTFVMPELSDHVHRVRVWTDRTGALRVEVTSEN
jgi:hypothetical protein